jgi:hypothetical protein
VANQGTRASGNGIANLSLPGRCSPRGYSGFRTSTVALSLARRVHYCDNFAVFDLYAQLLRGMKKIMKRMKQGLQTLQTGKGGSSRGDTPATTRASTPIPGAHLSFRLPDHV